MENETQKHMENEIETLRHCKQVDRDITLTRENQDETEIGNKMENDMETGDIAA